MSLHYYCVGEDNEKEESINNYKDLFLEYIDNPPPLKEALKQIFIAGGVRENEVNDYVNDITTKVNILYEKRKLIIKEKYPNISFEDSLIICSYTCEAINHEFSPYRTLNRNLASDNRKEGLKKVSKYLYILLMALRRLEKTYHPDEDQKYIYRGITFKVNTMIDPHRPKLVPYLRNKQKCFWAFTSASPSQATASGFLGDNGYHQEKKIKQGTIFLLYGEVWGYDITVFNEYNEEEILLEPERKFRIESVITDANDIIVATCEILDSSLVLSDLKKVIHESYSPSVTLFHNQNKFQCFNLMRIQMEDKRKKEEVGVFDILNSVLDQLECLVSKLNGSPTNISVAQKYFLMPIDKLLHSLVNDIKLFEEKYFEYIEKYQKIQFPETLSKESVINRLQYFRCMVEKEIKIIPTYILDIIQGKKPYYDWSELVGPINLPSPKKLSSYYPNYKVDDYEFN